MKRLKIVCILLNVFASLGMGGFRASAAPDPDPTAGPLDRQTTLWGPFVEWSLDNPSFSGNAFELVATVTFTHSGGETRTTEMFHDGGTTWKFRFTGTREGTWGFVSSSTDPELDGHTGTITVDPADPGAFGLVSTNGEKWMFDGRESFVPQVVMLGGAHDYANNPGLIDWAIQEFWAHFAPSSKLRACLMCPIGRLP